jgi:hypothetical protein
MIPQSKEDFDITIFKVFLAEQGEKGFRTHVSRCVWNYDEDISTGQPFLQGFFTGRKGKGCGERFLQGSVWRMQRLQKSGLPPLGQVERDGPFTAS